MDIKDFILIAGGLLIAAVIAHGFWIAWRNKTEPLRLDIVPDLLPDEGDDLARFKGELPNGGARLLDSDGLGPTEQQGDLLNDSAVPLLLEPNLATPAATNRDPTATGKVPVPSTESRQATDTRAAADRELFGEPAGATVTEPEPVKPVVTTRPRRRKRSNPFAQGEPDLFAKAAADPMPESSKPRVEVETGISRTDSDQPPRVAEVVLPDAPIVSDPSAPPANEMLPANETPQPGDESRVAQSNRRSQLRPARPPEPPKTPERRHSPRRLTPKVAPADTAEANHKSQPRDSQQATDADQEKGTQTVYELIVIHLLAPKSAVFSGPALVDSLRARGLKFGAMSIFHRVDPMTKSRDYSVVNMVEPGNFDLADLDNFVSPGLTFFMQLPGPEDPTAALQDMVDVARSLATELGGEVKDERMSVLTGQTVAHMRQRISDHARRRLSQRA